jgi:hypothetical protein
MQITEFHISTNWARFIVGDRPIVWLRENIYDLLKSLRTIYTSRSASPFDVDDNGRNIAHRFMRVSPIQYMETHEALLY